jgi:hypothetical protein
MMSRAALLAVLLLPGAAGAATWKVGPGAEITSLRQAGRQVQDGDRVEILPGEYYECAVWQANNLVITGPEDPATPAVLSDVACEGKASFVIRGGDVTVRHLTFTRVRVGDGNGAGIRAEGRNLTVEHSRFVNNQVGLLAGDRPDGVLVVRDSFFERNGICHGERCLASLHAGPLLGLRIERSVFTAARGGEYVRAAPQRSDIVDSRFADGPQGAAGRLVQLMGGAALVTGNVFQKGPRAAPPDIAVMLLDLWGGGAPAVFRGNTLENETGRPVTFVRSLSRGTVRLEDNVLPAGTVALDDGGYWMARARGVARSVLDDARWAAGKAKGLVVKVMNKIGI